MPKNAAPKRWNIKTSSDGSRHSEYPIGNSIAPASAIGFFTDFTGSENPLSEGGAWTHPGATAFPNTAKKVSGIAFDGGTATGFNDSVTKVSSTAFTPTRRVRITITLSVTGAFGSSEVEIHFNVVDTPTTMKLYEFDMTSGGVLCVKWLGTQGDIFFPLATVTGGLVWANSQTPETGDQVIIERTDNGLSDSSCVVTFNMWHVPFTDRGAQLAGVPFLMVQCQDSNAISGTDAYVTGQPGLGFDNGGAQNGNFAVADYRAENF